MDNALLINLMMIPYNLAAEFQYPIASPGRTPIANPLDQLINVALKHRKDPFKLLKSGTLLWFKALNPKLKCLDFETTAQQAVPLIQAVPFNYIVCESTSLDGKYGIYGEYDPNYMLGSYVPIINSGVSNDTIFIAQDPPTSAFVDSCKATYGITPMNADQLAAKYHMSQADYENSERIIFSVGQYDPTTSMGPKQLPLTANRNASKILYVSNMAHREELFAPDPRDKPEVVQVGAHRLL